MTGRGTSGFSLPRILFLMARPSMCTVLLSTPIRLNFSTVLVSPVVVSCNWLPDHFLPPLPHLSFMALSMYL